MSAGPVLTPKDIKQQLDRHHGREDRQKRGTKGDTITLPSPKQLSKLLGWSAGQTPLKYLLRFLPNGAETFVSILQASPDPNVQRFVKAWVSQTPKERKTIPLESLCESCDVSPGILIAEYSREAFELGADMARSIAAMGQVPIMAASVELASQATAEGTQERRMHFAAARFTPQAKGTIIMDHPTFKGAPAQATPTSTDLAGVPDFAGEQRELAKRVRYDESNVIDAVPLRDDE